jgi:hypothetical protein
MLIPGLKAGVIEEKSVNPRDRRPVIEEKKCVGCYRI